MDDAMDTRRVFLVLADISGYTRFARLHRLSQAHAETIICELLETVIAHTEHPMKLNELLGDAAFFYAPSDQAPAAAQAVLAQVNRFRAAFDERSRELTGDCGMCNCEACRNAGTLRLKVIIHEGESVITRLRGFEKLAGEDVILAHRLLKNSIGAQEYVAVTNPVQRLLGEALGAQVELRREHVEGIGEVGIAVYYPPGGREPATRQRSLRAGREALRRDLYAAGRIFLKLPKRRPEPPAGDGPPGSRA
jgi:class 3 adenylate cyclase